MDRSAKKAQEHLGRNAVFTAIFTFLAFAIAQFGLMTVVKKGYAYLGYCLLYTSCIRNLDERAVDQKMYTQQNNE